MSLHMLHGNGVYVWGPILLKFLPVLLQIKI